MDIFLSAGEASGDSHGAALIRSIRQRVPDAVFRGFGGPAMKAEGMDLLLDLTQYDVMWANAFKHIRELAGVLADAERSFASHPPDVVVPIDYPGFNLRLGARARGKGVKVVYYISPQVWAWWRSRITRIGRCVDTMLVIFPFEEAIYREAGIDCRYVGHPLMGRLAAADIDGAVCEELRAWAGDGVLVGVLPGSREQEVRRNLPVMLEAAEIVHGAEPGTRFVLPCRNARHREIVTALAGDRPYLRCIDGGVLEVMRASDLCLTTSGTTTVELMYFEKPMVVVYRVDALHRLVGMLLMRVPHIAMVNILAGRELVPEYLMCRKRSAEVAGSVLELVTDADRRRATTQALAELHRQLGGPEASDNAAEAVLAACLDSPPGARV